MSTTDPDPIPARRSAAGRPWRVAVIGAVAVLAVAIGLAAGSFLTTSRLSAVGAAAGYVPATASFYIEIQLEPNETQDAALRDVFARFPPMDGVDLERPLGDQLAELLDRAMAEDDLDLSWTDDVAPWTDGRASVAVLELPASAFDPMADPTRAPDAPPPMLVMLGVTDEAAARASVERILAEAGAPELGTVEHRGVTIHTGDDEPGAYAITDDLLIAAPSADDIVAALDAEAAGTTLAARDEIGSLIAALPSDWLAFGVVDFTDAMTAALDAQPSASSAAMARILEHQSPRTAFTVAASDGAIRFDAAAVPPTGPFAVDNADRGLAASVPADAVYFAEGGAIGSALAEIITAVKEAAASEPEAAEAIATAEAALGADLEELVAWIEDGAMAIGWDGTEPYGGLVLVPSDASAAERRLGQLATFARLAAMDPESGISLEETTVAGASVTTIRWVGGAAGGMMMGVPTELSVQYTVGEDRVLVGIGERFVGRVLQLDDADSLGALDRYADAVAAVGGPESTGTTWVDLGGIVTAVEEAAGAMLGADEETLAWLRPLDRLVGVARLEDGTLVTRTVLLVR